MPAPGDQHMDCNSRNPFEEVKPRISEYTAQEIATIQNRLEKQLGPEYISTRPGPSGHKIHYITGEKCIQLANEVFGFNGWSSSITNVQVDTVEENTTKGTVNLGLSVIVRVTLRDGTYHEDIGYGDVTNCKGKAAAFNKAKKEATTDALKRALRNFGNLLGNCLYDKDYLTRVMKVKAAPTKWDSADLYRPPDCGIQQAQPLKGEVVANHAPLKNATPSTLKTESFEDDFGDFDDDDFTRIGSDPDYDPDGVLLPESVQSGGRQPDGARNPSTTRASHKAGERGQQSAQVVTGTVVPQGPPRPQNQQQQPQPPQRNPNNAGISRSSSAAGSLGHSRVQTESVAASKPALPINPTTGRVLNQPNRTTASAPQSPVRQGIPVSSNGEEPPGNGGVPAQVGFFSARVADRLPQIPATEGPLPPLPADLVTFNPHAESPSIRRTPGVDHRSSKPLSRDLKPIGIAQGGAAQSPAAVRGNIVNPQFDMARKIGAPGSPSPMANRGSYKAPTMKRPLQQPNLSRPPLGDLPANGNTSAADGGGDTKRPRLSTS